MTVTKLERQKHRQNRWSVFIDGEFAFGMEETDMLYYKLSEGGELPAGRFEYIRDQVVLAEASQKALNYLSSRPRTVKEVERKLSGDYAPGIIERVMAMLGEYKYIDDGAYAEEYVKERVNAGYGPRRIEWELQGRGISRELIGGAMAKYAGAKQKAAEAALRARYRGNKEMDEKEKARAFGYLVRRGFDAETAEEAIRRA